MHRRSARRNPPGRAPETSDRRTAPFTISTALRDDRAALHAAAQRLSQDPRSGLALMLRLATCLQHLDVEGPGFSQIVPRTDAEITVRARGHRQTDRRRPAAGAFGHPSLSPTGLEPPSPASPDQVRSPSRACRRARARTTGRSRDIEASARAASN